MSTNSKIEWTDHTGGPWLGCTEVSPGCAHCYARELMLRRLNVIVRKAYREAGFEDWQTRPVWGDKAPRVKTKGFWTDARGLDAKAGKLGVRYKIFPSLIDWLDEMPSGIIDQDGDWLDKDEVLAEFLQLIHETPNLDWLLLTKRPENFTIRLLVAGMYLMGYRNGQTGDHPKEPATASESVIESVLRWSKGELYPSNVWIGTTVEDQKRADERIPHLLSIPARVRFLSCEPLLGPVDLTALGEPVLDPECWGDCRCDSLYGYDSGCRRNGGDGRLTRRIGWVICGGESGKGARPMHPDWARSLRDQCQAGGVPFLFKQWGDVAPLSTTDGRQILPFGEYVLPSGGKDGFGFVRLGKKRAGRLLDGREWNEFPDLIK